MGKLWQLNDAFIVRLESKSSPRPVDIPCVS